ncbi:hypothetical protein HDU84_009719, partial [Entophlyctis sp. JEL0112]
AASKSFNVFEPQFAAIDGSSVKDRPQEPDPVHNDVQSKSDQDVDLFKASPPSDPNIFKSSQGSEKPKVIDLFRSTPPSDPAIFQSISKDPNNEEASASPGSVQNAETSKGE